MIRILHLADVHLDAPLAAFGQGAERRRGELLAAFRRLPEVAEREEAAAVLVAGDLFDGPRPRESTLAAVRETFRRLAAAGRPVLLVPGNHDALTLRPSPYDAPLGDAILFREPVFGRPVTLGTPGGPLHVHGIAYDPAVEPDPLRTFRRTDEAGPQVVLLHGSVPDAPHWEAGRSLRLPVDGLAALGADYLALGDHHGFRPPAEFGPAGLPACYPGSFAAVDFTETGPRGMALVELGAEGPPSVRLLPAGVPEVVAVGALDVSACADDYQVVERVAGRMPVAGIPLVTLVGQPDFPVDADRVAEGLEARYGAARVLDRTRFYDSARVRELMRGKTIAAHVARLGVGRIETAGDEAGRRAHERALRLALAALRVE